MSKSPNELISDEIDHQESRHHVRLLAIFAFICAVCYAPRLFIDGEEIFDVKSVHKLEDIWRLQLIGHIGIAALIAAFLTLVEHSARRHLQLMIAFNAWRAALRNSMPKLLADELIEILKEPTYRKDARYHIVIKRYPGLDPNFLVVRRQINYTLTNATDRKQVVKVRSETDAKYGKFNVTDNGRPAVVPRQLALDVSVKADGLIPKGTLVKSLFRHILRKHYVSEILQGSLKAEETVHLGSRDTAEIYICAEEVLRIDQRRNVFMFFHPIENLTVTLSNECSELVYLEEPELNARSGKRFAPDHSASYRFRGGLLPGQSFEIIWSQV